MKDRIREIDALRGFALFGILLVNIFIFHAPYSYYSEFYGSFEGAQATSVEWVVNFAGGKFLFIFAFLFGYGIQLQQRSFTVGFDAFYLRKMIVLFAIGALHILLFWFGDILASYALLGILMLLIIRLPNRVLPFLGIAFLMFSPMYYLGVVLFGWPMVGMLKPLGIDEFMSVFQNGSYLNILPIRLQEFNAFLAENLVWYIPKTLGLFTLGFWCAGKELTLRIQNKKTFYLISIAILLISYSIWSVFKPSFFGGFDLNETPIMRPLLIAINIFFEIVLGSAYILGFLTLFQSLNKVSTVFEKAGRMALTNYIMQSLFCVFIFYGFGLGFYGKLQPTSLVVISIMIYTFNLSFSWFYLRFFNQGPLEYAWRKMSFKLVSSKQKNQ